jgi:hypothetical protein
MYKIIVVFLWLIFPTPAFAYIDPGTGSMVIQAFLALIATVFFYLKNPKELLVLIKELIKKLRK